MYKETSSIAIIITFPMNEINNPGNVPNFEEKKNTNMNELKRSMN